MNIEKQRAFIIKFIYIAFLFGLLYVGIKYLLPLLMPFVVGMIIAVIFRRIIDLIEKRIHIKRVFVSILILILFYGILGLIVSLIGFRVFKFLGDLFSSLPNLYQYTILPALQTVTEDLSVNFPSIKGNLDDFINNIDQSIFSFITNASTTVVGKITGLAGQLPTLLIKFIFMIVSSFFFTIDYYKITRFVVKQFKGERREMLLKMKNNGFGTLVKFIRAYSIIISITFVELSLGFWLLGIPNALLFGGLVAIIDVMPILGTGAILLPWSLIAFILGNTKIGAGMLMLYIFITAVRQTIEPKIVGQQIGLHPIVTLILMYVGAQMMGVLGLLILPILATILLKLNEDGTIHLFK